MINLSGFCISAKKELYLQLLYVSREHRKAIVVLSKPVKVTLFYLPAILVLRITNV